MTSPVARSAAASRSATGFSASSRASRRRSCSSRRARSWRSRSARSASRCSVLIGRLDLRAPLRARPLVGRAAALLDDPAGVALGLGGLVAGAGGGARLAVDRVARGVGLGDLRLRLLDLRLRGPLGLRGLLDLLDERVAPVALGEHAIGAAGRDLAQLARGGRPHAPVLGDRDAGEGGIDAIDVLDDPHVREDERGEPARGVVAGRASRGRRAARRPGRAGGRSARRGAAAGAETGRERRRRSAAAARRRRAARAPGRSARRRRPCPPLPAARRPASRSAATAARMRGPSAAVSASS